MTENEAKDCIEQLKHYNLKGKLTTPLNNDISMLWDGAFGIVMDLFEEIQQYRAIGTVEEFKRAKAMENVYGQVKWERDVAISQLEEIGISLGQKMDEFKAFKEKNTPKKVAYQGEHEKCPTCGSFHVFGKHCTECGQAVDYD